MDNDKDKDGEEENMAAVVDKEPKNLTVMAEIRKLAQKAMKEKGVSFNEVKKQLGITRYDK